MGQCSAVESMNSLTAATVTREPAPCSAGPGPVREDVVAASQHTAAHNIAMFGVRGELEPPPPPIPPS